ncbi:MAG TPA: SMP-30/gluconolactonase/LRE family protein, partial [Dehalococcoidia bacterium]|nr:SMP-30/gluconolactonase/LRE family protein [Dehalococcoidia bacterium]
MDLTTTILLDGLTFPECPRWHEGALWFSDVHAHTIIRMTPDGRAQRVIENAHQPAGLGWLPNGALLYVRMVDRTLVRVDGVRAPSPAESSDTGDVAQPPFEESPGRPAVLSSDKTVPESGAKDGSPPPFEESPGRPPANGHDTIIADLTHLEPVQLNDMTVDRSGRAYIGGFGFDINKGDPFATSSIYLVDLRDGARAPSPANSADTTSA